MKMRQDKIQYCQNTQRCDPHDLKDLCDLYTIKIPAIVKM